MLTTEQLDTYGDVLIWGIKTARTKKYKKGDIVMVQYDLPAITLAEVLQEKLLSLGINPVLRLGPTVQMEKIFYKKSNERQLVFQAPGTKELFESLNAAIYLHAPESLTHLKDIDPKRITKALIARKPFRDILFRKEEIGEFGWTLCTFPTPALAKHAQLSRKEYARQIVKACYLDVPHAVMMWNSIYRTVKSIKKWLNSMKVKWYHIESKHMDLRITPGKRRKWIGISGHNIPSFEIFISPDWRGTEGTYFANQPSFRSGNCVESVRLEFKKGSVVKVKTEKGEEFTKKQLAMDKGANKVGEFSLTDIRFSKIDKFMANTLYDENFGGKHGNCHIAVGSSYSDTYDGNPAKLTKEKKEQLGFNDSALHWDLVNTEEKTVTAHLYSGKKVVIYEKGEFTY